MSLFNKSKQLKLACHDFVMQCFDMACVKIKTEWSRVRDDKAIGFDTIIPEHVGAAIFVLLVTALGNKSSGDVATRVCAVSVRDLVHRCSLKISYSIAPAFNLENRV